MSDFDPGFGLFSSGFGTCDRCGKYSPDYKGSPSAPWIANHWVKLTIGESEPLNPEKKPYHKLFCLDCWAEVKEILCTK